MPPAIKVTNFKQPPDVHQDQGQGEVGDQAKFLKNIQGQEGWQASHVGEGRTDQQTDNQVTGHPRDMAQGGQPSPEQGADKNGGKGHQYIEQ